MKPRDGKSQVWLADHGEAPSKYSPQIHAALAVFFGARLTGRRVKLKELADVAGVSEKTLHHYIKGIRYKMVEMLKEVTA